MAPDEPTPPEEEEPEYDEEDEDELEEIELPTDEHELIRLARAMAAGFRAHPDLFPSPPISPDDLDRQTDALVNAIEDEIVSKAKAERARKAANRALDELARVARHNARFYEGRDEEESDGDDANTPPPEHPPGQVGFVEVLGHTAGLASLAWTEPREGDAVKVYVTMGRERNSGRDWKPVGLSVKPRVIVQVPPESIELEYYVYAINYAGRGPESNVARLVV